MFRLYAFFQLNTDHLWSGLQRGHTSDAKREPLIQYRNQYYRLARKNTVSEIEMVWALWGIHSPDYPFMALAGIAWWRDSVSQRISSKPKPPCVVRRLRCIQLSRTEKFSGIRRNKPTSCFLNSRRIQKSIMQSGKVDKDIILIAVSTPEQIYQDIWDSVCW